MNVREIVAGATYTNGKEWEHVTSRADAETGGGFESEMLPMTRTVIEVLKVQSGEWCVYRREFSGSKCIRLATFARWAKHRIAKPGEARTSSPSISKAKEERQ